MSGILPVTVRPNPEDARREVAAGILSLSKEPAKSAPPKKSQDFLGVIAINKKGTEA